MYVAQLNSLMDGQKSNILVCYWEWTSCFIWKYLSLPPVQNQTRQNTSLNLLGAQRPAHCFLLVIRILAKWGIIKIIVLQRKEHSLQETYNKGCIKCPYEQEEGPAAPDAQVDCSATICLKYKRLGWVPSRTVDNCLIHILLNYSTFHCLIPSGSSWNFESNRQKLAQ